MSRFIEKSLFRVPVAVPSFMLAFGYIVKNKTAPSLMELTPQWEKESTEEVPTVKFVRDRSRAHVILTLEVMYAILPFPPKFSPRTASNLSLRILSGTC